MRLYIFLLLNIIIFTSPIFSFEIPLDVIVEKLEPVKNKNTKEKLKHLLNGASESSYILSDSHSFNVQVFREGHSSYFIESKEEGMSFVRLKIDVEGNKKSGCIEHFKAHPNATVSGSEIFHFLEKLSNLLGLGELIIEDSSFINFEKKRGFIVKIGKFIGIEPLIKSLIGPLIESPIEQHMSAISFKHLHILTSKDHKTWYESMGAIPYDKANKSNAIINYKRAKEIFTSMTIGDLRESSTALNHMQIVHLDPLLEKIEACLDLLKSFEDYTTLSEALISLKKNEFNSYQVVVENLFFMRGMILKSFDHYLFQKINFPNFSNLITLDDIAFLKLSMKWDNINSDTKKVKSLLSIILFEEYSKSIFSETEQDIIEELTFLNFDEWESEEEIVVPAYVLELRQKFKNPKDLIALIKAFLSRDLKDVSSSSIKSLIEGNPKKKKEFEKFVLKIFESIFAEFLKKKGEISKERKELTPLILNLDWNDQNAQGLEKLIQFRIAYDVIDHQILFKKEIKKK